MGDMFLVHAPSCFAKSGVYTDFRISQHHQAYAVSSPVPDVDGCQHFPEKKSKKKPGAVWHCACLHSGCTSAARRSMRSTAESKSGRNAETACVDQACARRERERGRERKAVQKPTQGPFNGNSLFGGTAAPSLCLAPESAHPARSGTILWARSRRGSGSSERAWPPQIPPWPISYPLSKPANPGKS